MAASMGIILSPKRRRSAAFMAQKPRLIHHAAVNQPLSVAREDVRLS
jgi:hypothetical protein